MALREDIAYRQDAMVGLSESEYAALFALFDGIDKALAWAKAHEIHASDMHDDYNRGYGMACREVVTQIEKLLK